MDRKDITRISDLPDSAGFSRDNGSRGTSMSQQYKPLNVHQNPYGIPEPTDTQLPSFNQSFGGGAGGFSGEAMQPAPPPMMNRGAPQDTEMFQNDEQIRPNHIPSAKLTTDYLRDYEQKMAGLAEEHQKDKYRKDLMVSLYDEFQTPILIGVLFFLFQIPIINSFLFKYFGFLQIHNEDGNLNLYGLMLKSILFGLTYFGFVRLTT
jgi:hypothetical protein